jgi:excisionase family DNA binding protein
MATKQNRKPSKPRPGEGASVIEPHRLYTYSEVAEFCGGLTSDRTVRGWVEARTIGFVQLPGGRGRRISGRQYLDAIEAGTVDPEAV